MATLPLRAVMRKLLAFFDHKPAPPRAASFEECVRKRAYNIWQEEGRPHGFRGQHWASAKAAEQRINSVLETSLSANIEHLRFESELAEVQLLLDFISGRPEKSFIDNASCFARSRSR